MVFTTASAMRSFTDANCSFAALNSPIAQIRGTMCPRHGYKWLMSKERWPCPLTAAPLMGPKSEGSAARRAKTGRHGPFLKTGADPLSGRPQRIFCRGEFALVRSARHAATNWRTRPARRPDHAVPPGTPGHLPFGHPVGVTLASLALGAIGSRRWPPSSSACFLAPPGNIV